MFRVTLVQIIIYELKVLSYPLLLLTGNDITEHLTLVFEQASLNNYTEFKLNRTSTVRSDKVTL